MIVAERKKQILKIIQKNQFISLQELKKVTKTSLSTVRRDLDILAADGLVRRVHGGVEWIEPSRGSLPVSERLSLYQATKQKIAQRAAQQLQGGEIIFLDAGTTTGELIPYLADKTCSYSRHEFSPSCSPTIRFDDTRNDYWWASKADN